MMKIEKSDENKNDENKKPIYKYSHHAYQN